MANKPEKPKNPRKSRRVATPRPPADRGQGRGSQFEPTAEQRLLVQNAAAVGLTEATIAMLVINPESQRGINKRTLRLNFEAELHAGRAKAHFNVGKSIYDQAIGVPKLDGRGKQKGWISAPNGTLAIWYSKTQMGWHEKVSIDDGTLEAIVAGLGGNIEALRAARSAVADQEG